MVVMGVGRDALGAILRHPQGRSFFRDCLVEDVVHFHRDSHSSGGSGHKSARRGIKRYCRDGGRRGRGYVCFRLRVWLIRAMDNKCFLNVLFRGLLRLAKRRKREGKTDAP